VFEVLHKRYITSRVYYTEVILAALRNAMISGVINPGELQKTKHCISLDS